MDTITRQEAIDKMTDLRLENWSDTDTSEALIDGRIGYAEMDSDDLMELWVDCYNLPPVIIVGEDPRQMVEVPLSDYTELVAVAVAYRNHLRTAAQSEGEVATFHHIESVIAKAEGRN